MDATFVVARGAEDPATLDSLIAPSEMLQEGKVFNFFCRKRSDALSFGYSPAFHYPISERAHLGRDISNLIDIRSLQLFRLILKTTVFRNAAGASARICSHAVGGVACKSVDGGVV